MTDRNMLNQMLGFEDGLVFQIPQSGSFRGQIEGRPTICFATMCKNEGHCIRDTLASVAPFIDYWIVADTGSTDNTLEVIQEFFLPLNIPGKLFQHDWKGFDINKTIMFNKARGICDYILHIDADDILVGNFSFTQADSGKDRYYFKTKRGVNSYKSFVLWNGHLQWKWCGVAHTTVKCLNPPAGGLISGDLSDRPFYHNSRDTGSRSNDPEKYYKDALKLQEQFFNTLVDDPDTLNNRSVFYTAQSYYDSHRWKEASQWYALYTKLKGTWIEEEYESNIRIAHCLRQLNQNSNPLIEEFYIRAIKLLPERAEAYYHLGRWFNSNKEWQKAYDMLIIAISKNFNKCQEKYTLFVNRNCYDKYAMDEIAVSCYWLGRKQEGIEYTNFLLNDPEFDIHKTRLIQNMGFLSSMSN
ncbi:MAG: glycosyltransferase family 2 protein [Candidatus Paceibacterota bacterium]